MSSYKKIKSVCDEIGCEYNENTLLSNCTSFKIGGKADLFVQPDSVEKLTAVISGCKKNGIEILILGKGSNLLFSDEGFRGVVISTSRLDKIELIDETTIYCQSGVTLSKLCRFALDNSLTGLEFAYGIPGSVGGAVYMNAGAYGGEISDVVVSSEYYDTHNDILVTIDSAAHNFSHRHSIFHDHTEYIILSTTLKLKVGDSEEIFNLMTKNMSSRREKQPLEYPNAGSTFKRPEGYFAGKLIEDSGLKGYTIGGAQVSEKHAGFLINRGGATSSDVLSLMEHIKHTVKGNYGVDLESEIIYIPY